MIIKIFNDWESFRFHKSIINIQEGAKILIIKDSKMFEYIIKMDLYFFILIFH